MKTLNERLAYLAAILDGEGCISHRLAKATYIRKRDGVRGVNLDFRVSVANTDPLIINEVRSVADALNIKTLVHVCGRSIPGRKPVMHITFDGGKRVEAILTAVLPFLIAKRERADRTLTVIRYWRKARWAKGRQGGLSAGDDAWLMQQLGDLKFLNRRGPDAVEAR